MSSFNQFIASGQTAAGQATVFVTMPGNLFNTPTDNPPNVDPVPGILYAGGNISYGTDQAGNVVTKGDQTMHGPAVKSKTYSPAFWNGAFSDAFFNNAEDVYT